METNGHGDHNGDAHEIEGDGEHAAIASSAQHGVAELPEEDSPDPGA